MPFFRKKPVVVEAMQYVRDNEEIMNDLDNWLPGTTYISVDGYEIHTLEGVMTATDGDWIIKGVQGEFYPCKPDIFEATYESVDE